MNKQDLRQAMKQRKAAHTKEELAALSERVVAALCATPQWQQAHTVLLYHSLPDEVDTHQLIGSALQDGKRVLLPVVVGDDLELRFLPTPDALREGAFHILEPTGAPITDYAAIDLAVIPGVAFTPDGRRLGRGRGYYDRLLPRLNGVTKIGVCWSFQLITQLPTEAHDIAMDFVITAS